MSAHTPGSWHWDGPVHNYNPKEEAPWLVNDDDDWVLKGEIQCFGEANARLIAAAPELLDACKRLVNCMKLAGWEGDDSTLFAMEIIAKAEGKQLGRLQSPGVSWSRKCQQRMRQVWQQSACRNN